MTGKSAKVGALLLVMVLLIATCAVASATTYYVTSRRLNVRDGAGTEYDIIGAVTYGMAVEVYDTVHGWALIDYDDADYGYGWVSSKCISRQKQYGSYESKQNSAAANNFVAANYYAIVNPSNNYVNMRAQASKTSQILGIYYYGYQLKVIGEVGSWCQVMDESTGQVGFMLKSLLIRSNGGVSTGVENG